MMSMAKRSARVHELRGQLRRIPERLAESRRQLDAEQKLLDEVQVPWQQTETAIQQKEQTVKLALDTVEKFEEHMKRVTTQKEYLAARKQVDEARRLNERLQNEIIELRMKQEEVMPRLQELRARHANVLEEFVKVETTIQQERAQLDSEMQEEERQLRAEGSQLDSQMLVNYDRLSKGGRMPAIVAVVAGKCTGCNISLPPQSFNQLLAKNGSLFTCPNCNRLIYHQPPAAPAAESAAV
jgi:hypothetical protein